MDIIMISIIYILWAAITFCFVSNIIPYTQHLKHWEQFLVTIIITFGAPFMLITQAIELILDAFLAEGWNNK